MKVYMWKDYFNSPPRSLLVKAFPFIKNMGTALDLGSGGLHDSQYLLEQGFEKVIAIDNKPIAREIADTLPKEKFTYTISDIENFKFLKNNFDLINAQYSLPFISSDLFEDVFKKITNSLKKGGVLTGQFFGTEDDWRDNEKMTFFTLKETKGLLSDFEILYFEEEKEDKATASGKMKHWHVFHVIAKKK